MISSSVPALSKGSRKFFYATSVLLTVLLVPIAILTYQGPIELCQHIDSVHSLTTGKTGAALQILLGVCFVVAAALSRTRIIFALLIAAFALLGYEHVLINAIPNSVDCGF